MDAIPPCGSGMRGAHCKLAAFRPADNSPSRRHFHTRVPTLPMDTVYPISREIATVYFYKSAGNQRDNKLMDRTGFTANTIQIPEPKKARAA